MRIVWEANDDIGNIYKALARQLNLFLQNKLSCFPHERSFGFVRGRNIRENAKCHIGAKKLLKTDIKNFFPSIKKKRIEEYFIELDVSPVISALLADFLTISDTLPLGLATSPIISNAICNELDIKLKQLGDKHFSTYSRYADDITFSSDQDLPTIEDVTEIIDANGFTIANDKTRILKRGQNFYVTGLSVSDPKTPHAPRKMKKKLRQELYYAKKYGLYEHIAHLGIIDEAGPQRYINHLDGLVKYVAFHEPNLAKTIVPLWGKILFECEARPSFDPKNQDSDGFDIYIDETEFNWNKKNYLALGMSVSRHQELIDEKTQKILNDFIGDPFSDGKTDALEKNGLHFNDATEDLKLCYIKALQKLPFKGYIVFGELIFDKKYEETYLRLLQKIIKRRLMSTESKFARFSFEETDKISKTKLEKVITDSYEDLVVSNNRRPASIDVGIVTKKTLGVSVPDFLLGVFRKYVLCGEPISPPRREEMMFERLSSKYHIIFNADTGEEFSRRNPLKK